MSTALTARSSDWLRNPYFDLGYIVGTLLLGATAGAVVLAEPSLFLFVLTLDLWFLGYHHVIATWTRLTFDTDSFREHRFLVLVLPFVVVAGVVVISATLGLWGLTTLYLYWQWFHYTRQSYGISKIYRRKGPPISAFDNRLTNALLYAVPVWGILHRSNQDATSFLYLPVEMLPVPTWVVAVAATVTLAVAAVWAWRQGRAAVRGELAIVHALYLLSHVAVFLVGYIVVEDINAGWLIVNVWHNAQYLLIVWMYNNNRFKAGLDGRHRFLSTISQGRNAYLYFLVCFAITGVFYWALEQGIVRLTAATTAFAGLPLIIMAYQVVNFHHYIVDSLIWKVRKPAVNQHLGIASA